MYNNSISFLLDKKSIKYLFNIFENKSAEIRLVGGCVRDALLGKVANDIDVAAKLTTNEIINILNSNEIPYEDYAYKYGSVSIKIYEQKFQITALRKDVNQIGRNTNIIFTENWKEDAERRDFSINAIYLTKHGIIKDYFNGEKHLQESKIKFIGEIDKRIKEDYLRILRYYRFLGIFKTPKIIDGYEKILFEHFPELLKNLSNELIRIEIQKMLKNQFALNSFFEKKNLKKKYWIEIINEHFIKTQYEIGLKKCLNKIDLLVN